MKCPYCLNDETKVIDKRETEDLAVTRRRRECLKCEKRFTTYERVEMVDIEVVKKDGSRQQFSRDKVKSGILKACQKRPVSNEQIDLLIDKIESDIRKREKTEISSKEIGEMVIKKLKGLDKVAYIRFASVYREFDDINSFKKEIDQIK